MQAGASGFESAYCDSTPPWGIGRPQPAVVELEENGKIAGSVLDIGCGTGENALFLAERGHRVMGIDSAPSAIRTAREKAKQRRLPVDFRIFNALDLYALHEEFDTAIDSGFFHSLSDYEREIFSQQLAIALRAGGRSRSCLTTSRAGPVRSGGRLARHHREELARTVGRNRRRRSLHVRADARGLLGVAVDVQALRNTD